MGPVRISRNNLPWSYSFLDQHLRTIKALAVHIERRLREKFNYDITPNGQASIEGLELTIPSASAGQISASSHSTLFTLIIFTILSFLMRSITNPLGLVAILFRLLGIDMGLFLPAVEYPPTRSDDGYWAPVTSTINWCEEDYYATLYSAEIVNTLTNIIFILLGIKGLRNCMKYDHDSVFKVAFWGYLLVGLGSFAFHTTLKYSMQLVDELSMIYTVCFMCYATFSFERSKVFRQTLGASLLFLSLSITLSYHYLQIPAFHQAAFGVLITIVLFRSMYVMEFRIRKSLHERYTLALQKGSVNPVSSGHSRDLKKDMDLLNKMWLMVGFGLSIFLGGFLIWNLDNRYCSTLRYWRHKIGLPWGILLEGHGWWHLMTGFGTYIYLIWGVWLRYFLTDRQREFGLNWPSIFFSIPEVVPISITKTVSIIQSESPKAK